MDIITASYMDILRPRQGELADLAVPGELIRTVPTSDQSQAAAQPIAFGAPCTECGETLTNIAQFWAHGRLWALGFCPDWSSHANHTPVFLRSAGPEDGLVVDAPVKGNSAWARLPVKTLLDPYDPLVLAHLVLVEVGLQREHSEEFMAALAALTGASAPDAHWNGVPHWGHSCLGGAEMPMNWPHVDMCPHCDKRLTFLGQFGPEVGFYYGDSGVAYAFVCLDHPAHTVVDCQMA